MQLAHKRYRFMQWFEAGFGIAPTFNEDGTECDLLFPLGRADRAYVLLLPGYYGATQGKYRVYCFQWVDDAGKAGGYKKVYYADLNSLVQSAPKGWRRGRAEPINSIFDYLTYQEWVDEGEGDEAYIDSYVFTRSVSQYARNDLALKRSCVMYQTNSSYPNDLLFVSVMSDAPFQTDPDMYNLQADPFTGSETGYMEHQISGKVETDTTTDKFFRLYGLPVARQELAMFR